MRRAWTLVGVAALIAACSGKAIIDPPVDGAGAGGTTASSTTATTTTDVSTVVTSQTVGTTGPATATVSSTGSGPPPPCAACGEWLQGGVPFEQLCPEAQLLAQALFGCVCDPGLPDNCADICAEACEGFETSEPCSDCIFNVCSQQLDDCLNDF